MANEASFTRLNDGTWGVRVNGAAPASGAVLTVKKRDGSTQSVTVAKVLWHGTAKDGREASLVAIESDRATSGGSKRQGRRNWKGQECPACGSEPLDAQLECWECGFKGHA